MSTTTVNPFPRVYEAAHLAELGVSVEEFVADPDAALARVGQYDACALIRAGLRPLLPVQVRLRLALEKQWEVEGTPVKRLPLPRPLIAERTNKTATLAA